MSKVKIAAIAALIIGSTFTTPAVHASSWTLVSCDYEAGTGFVGTYRSNYGTGQYTRRLVFQGYCPSSI